MLLSYNALEIDNLSSFSTSENSTILNQQIEMMVPDQEIPYLSAIVPSVPIRCRRQKRELGLEMRLCPLRIYLCPSSGTGAKGYILRRILWLPIVANELRDFQSIGEDLKQTILFVIYISFIRFFVEFFISVCFNVDLFEKQEKALVEHRFERINRDFVKRHEQFYCWCESAIVFDMEIFSLI